jgi:hypothetical protein
MEQVFRAIYTFLDVKLYYRSQSYDLGIYNLQLQRQRCSSLEHFSKFKKIFLLHNTLGYSWRCKFLQLWRCNSKS